ncbi:MAG: hypothetical protein M3112_11510 [Actinomycetia bacterium]|nr:hypothetical protein [Actinomycetes bacterium]
MRKIIGYFDGTESALLTNLVCEGYDTMPISNGFDNHGMNVRIINKENRVDVLVGYLHKIYSPKGSTPAGAVTYQDVFHVCRTFDIPLVLQVDSHLHDEARALMADAPPCVLFVDPSDALEKVRQLLDQPSECSG